MEDTRGSFLKATWVNLLGNLLKILVEGSLGLVSGSLALTADAAHSLADLLASGVVLVWGRVVYDDPDETHPHGHERFEPLAALFVGGLLILLGLKLLYDSGHAVLTGPSVTYSHVLVAGLLFSIVDMYLVYRYTRAVNREVDSPSLRALAADCLNDIYTTLAVLVGVLGMAGGYPLLDPLAGGVVSLLVVYHGVDIARENVGYLTDRAAPESTRAQVEDAVLAHPAVHGVHDLVAYYRGTAIEVEFHAEIDAGHSIADAHDIETDLRRRVRGVEDVSDVHVHLDPDGVHDPDAATDGSAPTTVGGQSTGDRSL